MIQRYWISDKHRLNFLGIPKCASTSIRRMLDIDTELDWQKEPKKGFKTFTVIRDPIDRFRSGYIEARKRQTLPYGVNNVTEAIEYLYGRMDFFDEHLALQSDYLHGANGVKVFMMNNFKKELEKLTGTKIEDYRLNSTIWKPELTDKNIEMLKDIYEEDFQLFQK